MLFWERSDFFKKTANLYWVHILCYACLFSDGATIKEYNSYEWESIEQKAIHRL